MSKELEITIEANDNPEAITTMGQLRKLTENFTDDCPIDDIRLFYRENDGGCILRFGNKINKG